MAAHPLHFDNFQETLKGLQDDFSRSSVCTPQAISNLSTNNYQHTSQAQPVVAQAESKQLSELPFLASFPPF